MTTAPRTVCPKLNWDFRSAHPEAGLTVGVVGRPCAMSVGMDFWDPLDIPTNLKRPNDSKALAA